MGRGLTQVQTRINTSGWSACGANQVSDISLPVDNSRLMRWWRGGGYITLGLLTQTLIVLSQFSTAQQINGQ